ncbi:MAG: hypothetical protein ABJC39_11810 [Chloroflexota bacterium]
MVGFASGRWLGVVAALVLTLSAAPTALAGAQVGTFHFETSFTDPTSLPECMPTELADVVGVQAAIETTDGRFTAQENGFHVEGTVTFAYRVDFPDGRYAIGIGNSRFATDFTASGQSVNGEVTREPRTIYAADGSVLVRVLISAGTHVTFRDGNGNGQPDPGEISVAFERLSFICGR